MLSVLVLLTATVIQVQWALNILFPVPSFPPVMMSVLILLPAATASTPNVGPSPCAATPTAAWCTTAGPPFAPRAAALVADLTATEKAQLLRMVDGGVPRLSIPPYIWWSEALHGAIAPFQHHSPKPSTCWPEPITVGASFNASLFAALGTLTSTEGRGMQNGTGNAYWAPNVNIMRDPRWGRGQETPGEDPTLTSTYAHHFVAAMQGSEGGEGGGEGSEGEGSEGGGEGNEGSSPYLKTSATLKHFAAYSQETGRINDPVVVSQKDMEETYVEESFIMFSVLVPGSEMNIYTEK